VGLSGCKLPLPFLDDVFGTLNGLEKLGAGSLSELLSLHGIKTCFSTKDVACDMIAHHLATGTCDNADGELCPFVRSSCVQVPGSNRSGSVSLQSYVLDGVLTSANRKA